MEGSHLNNKTGDYKNGTNNNRSGAGRRNNNDNKRNRGNRTMKKLIRTIISVTMLASLSLNALGFHGGYFQHALESTKLVIEGEIQSDRELAMRTFSGNIDEDLRSW